MQVEINFHIYNINHRALDNNQQFMIRRQVAQIFENSEFGRCEEIENDKFMNTFAIPIDDNFIEENNELYISYVFPLPLTHGNLGILLIQEIPDLHDWILEHYHDINCVSNIIYS